MTGQTPIRPPQEAQVLREYLASRTVVVVTANFQYVVDGPPEGAEGRALAAYFSGVEPAAQLDVTAEVEGL